MASDSVTPLGELNPDYVLLVAFPQTEDGEATEQAQQDLSLLVEQLSKYGFYTQLRPADDEQVLLFVKVSDSVLLDYLKGEGVKEYLYGVRTEIDGDESLIQSLSATTKLNAVYSLLTDPELEGGAGIAPGSEQWKFVKKISPVWDYEENKRLVKSFLKFKFTEEDVETIREVAGEKVALYFAFVTYYYKALAIPAVIGIVSRLLSLSLTMPLTLINSLWAIVFLASWRKRQTELSLKWKTTGVSKVEVRRGEFIGETVETDPITGKSAPAFSPAKRTLRQIAFLPIALAGIFVLVSYQVTCFFIEITLTEIYQGPGKAILGLVPTVLIVGFVPVLTAIYGKFVDAALAWENHEFQSSYDASKTQKMYVYNFLSSYVPLFITCFFYIPFGHLLNSYVPTISASASKYNIPVVTEYYQINNDRLSTQFGYFTLTAQIVSFLTENIVPVAIRLIKEKMGSGKSVAQHLDSPQERAYLSNVRQQLALPEFDVDAEYRELVMQFGYLVLFGPVWPLAPAISFLFNWIEIRGDAEKLFLECSRPVPRQAESIKPWDTHIRILTWLGSITGPVVTAMYGSHHDVVNSAGYHYDASPIITPGWKLASVALVAENIALALNFTVETLYKNSTTAIEKEHRAKEVKLRRSYVEAYTESTGLSKRSTDVVIDPTTRSWKQFNSSDVLKQATALPALLLAAKKAADKAKEAEKAEKTSEKVDATAETVPVASSGYEQHSSDGQLRSTTASKTVPQTAAPTEPTTADVPVTTKVAAAAAAIPAAVASAAGIKSTSAPSEATDRSTPPQTTSTSPYNAGQPSSTDPSSGVVGGGVAAGIASAVGIKPSEVAETPRTAISEASLKTSGSPVPSDRAAIGIPVPDSAKSTSTTESETPKKKRGFFGLGKKDLSSVGKAAKADAARVAPEVKAVGADVAKGDFSSAKKVAAEAKANPDKFIGSTKLAVSQARETDEPVSSAPAAATSAAAASDPATAPASSTAPSAQLPETPSTSNTSSGAIGSAAAAVGVADGAAAASSSAGDESASDVSTPSKSRGLFGLHKKDLTSFGKAAKADASKWTPDAKKVASDLKHGDFTSAKKLASDVKAHPDEYFGNTKAAYKESREGHSSESAAVAIEGTSAPSAAAPVTSETSPAGPSSSGSASAGTSGIPGTVAAATASIGAAVGATVAAVTGSGSGSTSTGQVEPALTSAEVDAAYSNIPGSLTGTAPSAPSDSAAPSGSTASTPSTSGPTDKAGGAGLTSGLGLGAVAGAVGLGSADKGSSTPSSTTSLAGATLPPDFEKRSKKSSNLEISSAAVSTPQKQTLDPNVTSPAGVPGTQSTPVSGGYSAVPAAHPTETNTTESSTNYGVLGGAAAAVTAAGAGLSSKLSSNGGESQKISSNLTEEKGSYLDTAKQYAEKGGSTLNQYVQMAADKADEYAKKSDNEYVTKGNTYLQKFSDQLEDYSERSSSHNTSAGAAAMKPSKTGAVDASSSVAPEVSDKPAGYMENTNPFSGDTGVVTNTGKVLNDDLAPPKLNTDDAHSQNSSNVPSPRKKKGLFSKIKDKVNSPSTTPKKH